LRILLFLLAGLAATVAHAAQMDSSSAVSSPLEIVHQYTDYEVAPDGSYSQASETAYRILNDQGRKAMQQVTLSYTNGYQVITGQHSYTLKADGRRIDVDPNSILFGYGATTTPGFEDVHTVTIIFPNLEVGDQAVLATATRQVVPWFAGQFAYDAVYTPDIKIDDVRLTLTAPRKDLPLSIDTFGVQGGLRASKNGKSLWVWTYHNDTPQKPEPLATEDPGRIAHVSISTFTNYADIAKLYADLVKGKADVTVEIRALANKLTENVSDRREQARILHDWVATHIAYVAIVLGAGGFVPHSAAHVLEVKYGDCKDHVMLLEALLKAKGIASTPALINTAAMFKLPATATPFVFNHMITYIPEFNLFTDSTARFAPFGILPPEDSGKPVVLIASGETPRTPVATANDNRIAFTETIHVHGNGDADGETEIRAHGQAAIAIRQLINALPVQAEETYFQRMLGPGATGSFDRSDINALNADYNFKVRYAIPGYANQTGTGALPAALGYKPVTISETIGGTLPDRRTRDYVCGNIAMTDDVTVTLPAKMKITSVPDRINRTAQGLHLQMISTLQSGNRIHEQVSLRAENPTGVCSAESFNTTRTKLMQMLGDLRNQILYKWSN